LINGSFEGDYTERGAGEIKVAPGWNPWYSQGKNDIPGLNGGGYETNATRRPEMNKAAITLDPYRVRLGKAAQHWFCYSGCGYAGVLQQVPAAPGTTYRSSVWAQAWCGDKDSDPHSCKPDIAYISIGIDPDGGDWYGSRAIVWTQWAMLNAGYQQVQSVPVVARAARVTVYISVCFKYAATHNDVYLDDAALVQVEGAVVPPPEPEPEPPPVGADVDYARIRADFAEVLAEWDRR